MTNKKNICCLLCIILFLFPITVIYADEASDAAYYNQNRLKKIASNINYDYSYHESNGQVTFSIRFTNVLSDVYIHDVTHNKNYYTNKDNTIVISGFGSGKTYEFLIKDNNYSEDITMIQTYWDGEKFVDRVLVLGKNPIPPEKEISKIYVTLPKYNSYYNDPVCQDFSEYKLCQKWYSHNLSHDEFVREVNQAKSNNEKKPIVKAESEDKWTDFFRKHWVLIVCGSSAIVIIVVLLSVRFAKNRDGFEGW